MDSLTVAVWGLVATIAIAFIGWLFKTPKDMDKEMSGRVNMLIARQEQSEDRHHALDKGFIEFKATVISELRKLTDAIHGLTDQLREMRTTGEHRIVKRRGD